MYNKLMLLMLFFFTAVCPILAQEKTLLQLHYDTDVFILDEAKKKKLSTLADTLQGLKIEVTGHTDDVGSDSYNQNLANQRATQVAEFLQQLKPELDITINYFGESMPAAGNNSATGRAANRRVEIKQVKKLTTNITDLYKLLSEEQRFCIDPTKDTVLVGSKGTLISIKAGSFDFSGISTSCPCLTIILKEVFDRSTMIIENASTTSNGELLESEGMLYVEAECNKDDIGLKQGAGINILLPTEKPVPGMKLFFADRDEHGHLNWGEMDEDTVDVLEGRVLNGFNMLSGCGGSSSFCPFFFCRIKQFFWSKSRKAALRNLQDFCEQQRLLRDRDSARLADLEARMEDFEANNFKGLAQEDLQYYVFRSPKLGWINMDRFAKLPEPKITYRVLAPQHPVTDVKLVFRDIKSIMPGMPDEKEFAFGGIPLDYELTIVALRFEDNQAAIFIKDVKSKKDLYEDVEFMKVTPQQLKAQLKVLDQ